MVELMVMLIILQLVVVLEKREHLVEQSMPSSSGDCKQFTVKRQALVATTINYIIIMGAPGSSSGGG